MARRTFAACLSLVLVASACGGGGDEREPTTGSGSETSSCTAPFQQAFGDVKAYPVFASSEVVVGSNRFLVGILDDNDAPIASPDVDVHIEFFDLTDCPPEPAAERDMDFLWSIKGVAGLYRTQVGFDSPGTWGAEVTISGAGLDETVKASFDVRASPTTPAIGSRPPASDTPTADDVKDLSEISTDDNPDPRFYEVSIASALERGEPFVVAFATPKFCQTQTCGPTLEIVKSVAEDFPKLTFIHVEPYELPADPSNLEPVQAVDEWGLPSEPWVFVVDGKGRVAAKFEGSLAPEELKAALQEL